MVQLEAWVENKVIRFWPSFQKVRTGLRHLIRLTITLNHIHNVSKDPNVYIYSGARIQHTARVVLLLLIILLLLVPVVVCNIVSTTSGRGCCCDGLHDVISLCAARVNQIESDRAYGHRSNVSCGSIHDETPWLTRLIPLLDMLLSWWDLSPIVADGRA